MGRYEKLRFDDKMMSCIVFEESRMGSPPMKAGPCDLRREEP
jgi:hypothetical protein